MRHSNQKRKLHEMAAHLNLDEHSEGQHSAEDSDNELWLVSYADLMTLLFGFFVLMYVFASQHNAATIAVQNKIAEQFGGETKSYIALQAQEIRTRIRDFSDLKDIEVYEDTEGVTLSFKNQLLFSTASAEMNPQAASTLNTVISHIKDVIIDAPLIIEGHTDDRAVGSSQFVDNWDLSAARAVAVLRVFKKAGFSDNHLSAVGMGSSRPLFANRDASGAPIQSNMDLNRRVVVKIHFQKSPPKDPLKAPATAASKI